MRRSTVGLRAAASQERDRGANPTPTVVDTGDNLVTHGARRHSVLKADQAPDRTLPSRHLRLPLPRQHGDPADDGQAAVDLAGRVDPRVAVHELHLIDADARL